MMINEKRGLLLVFLTAVVSGFSIFINKFGVAGIDATLFTFAKNALVAIVLVSGIFLVSSKDIRQLTRKQWAKLGLIGLVGGSVPFIMFFNGLKIASGVNGAFIHKTMFIFIALGALYFLKEKLSKSMLIGALLLLVGNGLLLKFGWTGLGIGEALIFGATLLWAVEQLIAKHTLKELSGNIVGAGRMFFGSIFIFVYMAFTGKVGLISTISFSQAGWVLVTSIFLLLYVMTWYNGLKYVNVSVAAPVLLLGSVITTGLNFVFSGAAVSAGQAAGIGMLLVGLVLSVGYTRILTLFMVKDENR
jgi:drug/metabolite transporter (DMT)-like permease